MKRFVITLFVVAANKSLDSRNLTILPCATCCFGFSALLEHTEWAVLLSACGGSKSYDFVQLLRFVRSAHGDSYLVMPGRHSSSGLYSSKHSRREQCSYLVIPTARSDRR
jgi:hypothetical protein